MGTISQSGESEPFVNKLKIRDLLVLYENLIAVIKRMLPEIEEIKPLFDIATKTLSGSDFNLKDMDSMFSLEDELDNFLIYMPTKELKGTPQEVKHAMASCYCGKTIRVSVYGFDLVKISALHKTLLFEVNQFLKKPDVEVDTKPLPVLVTNPTIKTEPSEPEKKRLEDDSKKSHSLGKNAIIVAILAIVVVILIAVVQQII